MVIRKPQHFTPRIGIFFVSAVHAEGERERRREDLRSGAAVIEAYVNNTAHKAFQEGQSCYTDRVLSAKQDVKRINCSIQRMGITDRGIKLKAEGGEEEEQEGIWELKIFLRSEREPEKQEQ